MHGKIQYVITVYCLIGLRRWVIQEVVHYGGAN